MKETKWSDFPSDEYTARWEKASREMARQGIDALLLTQHEDVRYFSGYLSLLWCSKFRPFVVILPQDHSIAPTMLLPAQERGNSMTSWIEEITFYRDQADPVPILAQILRDKGLHRSSIGTELGFGQRLGMTFNQFQELKTKLPQTNFVDASRPIQALRMIKSPAEIECLRKACGISQTAVQEGWESLKPGMSEKELMAGIISTMYREGAEPGIVPSTFAIRAGQERASAANALATDTVIKQGDFIVLDAGACYKGYICDFIRQAFLGQPTKDQLELFQLTIDANNAAIDSIRPGVTCADVYEAAIKVFEEAGVSQYSLYNIVGHGVGLEIHEIPWLGERDIVYSSETVLAPGMCFCVEPAIAGLKNLAGVPDPDASTGRFIVEDVVVVTEEGCENLTSSLRKDLCIIS